jgi:5-methylcytosine-specific restriction protein A
LLNINFDYISDPEKKIVIDREELNTPDFAGSFWNSQGSGKTIPYKISQALERLWASRTGTSEIQYPEQILTDSILIEGATKRVQVNVFERDSKARQQCIDYYGLNCVVCNFHFVLAYGQLAKGYIHVHHLTPLSEINEEYVVNPIEDLRPVCPNCHAMLHQKGVSSGIDGVNEIQQLFKIYNK